MLRFRLSRQLALAFAFIAAFAAPLSAVSHGQAHVHQSGDHGDVDHHAQKHAPAHALQEQAGATVAEATPGGSGSDHQHPDLSAPVTMRTAAGTAAVVSQRIALLIPSVLVSTARSPEVTGRAGVRGLQALPPNLRGPPGFPA